jgi:V8-like Glu-specific endopeptidase
MSRIITSAHYPWPERDARELHAVLSDLFPTARTAMFVAVRAGVPEPSIFTEQAAYLVWVEILNEAAQRNKLKELVTIARDQKKDSPYVKFLDEVLANQGTIATNYQPRDADGAPAFIASNDQITENEALLFRDDLTLEFGRIPWLIGVLQHLHRLGGAVCRLESLWPDTRQRGTAFRVGPATLLTNWHVLNEGDVAALSATAEFRYEDDGNRGGLKSISIPCDVTTIRGNAKEDWAIIGTSAPIDGTIPILPLSASAEPRLGDAAFIVQHPGGDRKRIAYVRNQITDLNDQAVHYLSDTQAGSSGSPVLDDQGRLIALHRAGGRPREVAGKPPLRKNEGVRIPLIVAGLGKLGISLP